MMHLVSLRLLWFNQVSDTHPRLLLQTLRKHDHFDRMCFKSAVLLLFLSSSEKMNTFVNKKISASVGVAANPIISDQVTFSCIR